MSQTEFIKGKDLLRLSKEIPVEKEITEENLKETSDDVLQDNSDPFEDQQDPFLAKVCS
jgi:hypothetical protein